MSRAGYQPVSARGCPRLPASPVDALDPLIGMTPLLEIVYRFDGRPRRIYAKYELENMTGSVKDRMAAHILRRAYAAGALRPGDTLVEASSGNTGISLAAIGRALGHPVRIYMPDWMSRERVQLIQNFGAEVIPVSREQDGFVGALEMAQAWAGKHDDRWASRRAPTSWAPSPLPRSSARTPS